MITHVAMYNPTEGLRVLPKPHRHCDLFKEMIAEGISTVGWTQGFWDSKRHFVDRYEAYKLAVESGQLKPENRLSGSEILTSEDIW